MPPTVFLLSVATNNQVHNVFFDVIGRSFCCRAPPDIVTPLTVNGLDKKPVVFVGNTDTWGKNEIATHPTLHTNNPKKKQP